MPVLFLNLFSRKKIKQRLSSCETSYIIIHNDSYNTNIKIRLIITKMSLAQKWIHFNTNLNSTLSDLKIKFRKLKNRYVS